MTTTLKLADKETRSETIRAFLDEKLDALITKATDESTLGWWKNILRLAGSFYRYSFNNLCLIYSQIEHPTFVAGAHAWNEKYGRLIAKGSKACWILAPMIVKKEDKKTGQEKKALIGFRTVPVFDFSQTVPMGEDAFQDPNSYLKASGDATVLLAKLEAFVASKGWTLEYAEKIPGSARGFSAGKRIVVLAGLGPADRAKILAHEIGHELLHWVDGKLEADHSKSWKETEAESVAYAICQAFGVDSNSELYLNAWAATKEIVKASTTRIFGAVREVLTFAHDEQPAEAE